MQLHLYALLHNPLHVAHNSFNVVAFAGKASSCCNANANAIWHVASGRCKVATGLGLVALHKGHGAYACVCVCAPTCGDLLGYKLFIAYCSMPRRSAIPRPRPTAMQQFASLCHICASAATDTDGGEAGNCTMHTVDAASARLECDRKEMSNEGGFEKEVGEGVEEREGEAK